ncbi:MAG: DNA photolyase, partial [Deltaproteobacteria bacterium]|nr:DNA photolyase [Deltaproteobacteria bacterium]
MKRPSSAPRSLVVEEASARTPLAESLMKRLPLVQIVPSIKPAHYANYDGETLILAEHRGAFVKPCPGTRGYICCGLMIIHLGLGCNLNCTYCILQSYLDTQALVVFSNFDQGLRELERVLSSDGPRPRRFCTGEFTDSLLLEDLTGLGARLVTLFAGHKDVLLELKTKTDNVDSLCGLNHGGRSIVSFSVNAPAVAASEESGAVPLKRRITAAKRMVEEGYRVGFHFDPLIRHAG